MRNDISNTEDRADPGIKIMKLVTTCLIKSIYYLTDHE